MAVSLFGIIPGTENSSPHPDHIAAGPDGIGKVAAHAHGEIF